MSECALLFIPAAQKQPEQEHPYQDTPHQDIGDVFGVQQKIMQCMKDGFHLASNRM